MTPAASLAAVFGPLLGPVLGPLLGPVFGPVFIVRRIHQGLSRCRSSSADARAPRWDSAHYDHLTRSSGDREARRGTPSSRRDTSRGQAADP